MANSNLKHRKPIPLSGVDILENIYLYKWYFFLTTFFIFLIALLYALFSAPIWIADGLVQVEDKKASSLGSALSQISKTLDVENTSILAEIDVLRSRTLLSHVAKDLHLNINIVVLNRPILVSSWIQKNGERDENGLVKPLWGLTHFAWGGEQLNLAEFQVPKEYINKKFILKLATRIIYMI